MSNPTVNNPWLSVLMPTYNGQPYLVAALESIAAEGGERIEVIAVDDGSTDQTVSILESYAGRLPLRIVRRQHTGNWVAGTNHALSLARGEHVCCLHQDDYWQPGRLRAVKELLSGRPETAMVLHPSWYVDAAGNRMGLWRCPLPPTCCPLDADLLIQRLLVQNFISMPGATFRRRTALAAGGLDEQLWYTADWDLWLKLAAAGPVMYCAQPLASFRIHADSQTARRSAAAEDYRRQHEIVVDRHLRAWPAGRRRKRAVRRAARFSIELNASLAACAHRQRPKLGRLAMRLAALGPLGLYRFFRDSRIIERAGSRLRLRTGWLFGRAIHGSYH